MRLLTCGEMQDFSLKFKVGLNKFEKAYAIRRQKRQHLSTSTQIKEWKKQI
jgi:hypothetical protein